MAKVILKIAIFMIAFIFKDVLSNRCKSKQTCGECIAEHSHCAWCSQENFGYDGSPRCDYVRNLVERNCDYEYINNPMNSLVILENEELGQGYHRGNGVHQIRPQKIKLALRPNSVQRIRVEFLQSEDYPLDVYLFMDLSTADDKRNMVQLGHILAEELPNITSNFRVGFGTFVYKQRESCPGCSSSYAFHNVMSLSDDTNRFAHMIEEAPGSVTLDAPDGGVDAIMKAIVCKGQIGWRLLSRKILLYVSDTYYNYTVHGQLDGKPARNHYFCRLDNSGYFSEGTGLDYPSPSAIDYHISKNDMHIIFAVISHQRPLYEALTKNLNDSSIGELDGDLTNIIDLIREQYDNIRSSVQMKSSVYDKMIKLTYYSKCLGSKLEKTSNCKGLKKGDNVTFEVEIELKYCPPKDMHVDKKFSIYPIGVRSQLMVDMEMLCECECQKHGITEINSPKCNRYGTFECGICICNDNSFGKNCECGRDIFSESHMDCKINEKDPFLCSGRGECICGVCNCMPRQNPEEMIYGSFCECDNFSCDRHNGAMCSGPDHGICECGWCMCRSGWTGSDCSCRASDESCFNDNGELCSGHGACVCGSCVCNDIDGKRYFGEFCEDSIDDTPANNEEDTAVLDGIFFLLQKIILLR